MFNPIPPLPEPESSLAGSLLAVSLSGVNPIDYTEFSIAL
jgi:hypothetical protein